MSTRLPRFHKLDRNLRVDAVVIGGGATGITTAYLLKKAGVKVALLERYRCAQADTGHTTAHLTYVTDTRLPDLVEQLGDDHARAVWEAGHAGIEQIETIVREHEIACEFRRVPGYLHLPVQGRGKGNLEDDATIAARLGFDAQFVSAAPLVDRPAVRFANQAKFHAQKYLAHLLPLVNGRGSYVFEQTNVDEIKGSANEQEVHANGRTIKCKHVIVCTHVPLMGKAGLISASTLQTQLSSKSSYVIAARLPRGSNSSGAPEASFWDTGDPYFYLRIDRKPRYDVAIFGGLDHKTGQATDTEKRYEKLEAKLRGLFPKAQMISRWSGQVVETKDGLPYMGEDSPGQFVSTGYNGNGITFGTVAAMMARDLLIGTKNPWAELFSVRRQKLRKAWDYVRENVTYPYYFAKDRLSRASAASLGSVKPGTGKVLQVDGQKLAIYKAKGGAVTKMSPYCTHLGCVVDWNKAESTWDCPCHGSRFKPTGEVFAGPAETPLERKQPK